MGSIWLLRWDSNTLFIFIYQARCVGWHLLSASLSSLLDHCHITTAILCGSINTVVFHVIVLEIAVLQILLLRVVVLQIGELHVVVLGVVVDKCMISTRPRESPKVDDAAFNGWAGWGGTRPNAQAQWWCPAELTTYTQEHQKSGRSSRSAELPVFSSFLSFVLLVRYQLRERKCKTPIEEYGSPSPMIPLTTEGSVSEDIQRSNYRLSRELAFGTSQGSGGSSSTDLMWSYL